MTLLLLAGTGEARRLAEMLHAEGVDAIASIAGETRDPRAMPLSVRSGGFGSADAFGDYLRLQGITRILDATHPFAAKMSHRSARVADEMGIAYLQLLRPAWRPQQGDRWHEVPNEAAVAELIEPRATVFLATGRKTLEQFSPLAHCRLICRQIDPPSAPFPFPNGTFLVGRPPFSVEDEMALFERLGIDWLVVKNAGGAASATKLVAARNLGLPVAMIARPAQPDCARVETIDEALLWAKG